MKYLTPDQVVDLLNAGRAVEQWLGHENTPKYRSLRWLRIDPERSGCFSVATFEVFDDGSPEMLDIYAFEPVDPDAQNGNIASFESPGEALKFAIDEKGASAEKFVGSGMIQDVYASFLQEHGVSPK